MSTLNTNGSIAAVVVVSTVTPNLCICQLVVDVVVAVAFAFVVESKTCQHLSVASPQGDSHELT